MRTCVSLLAFILVFSVTIKAQTGSTLFAALGKSPYAIQSETKALTRLTGKLDSITHLAQPDLARFAAARIRCLRATGSTQFILGSPIGILRPFINPSGWQLLTDWHFTEVLDLEIDPFIEKKIFAATAMGIFFTENNGTTWQTRNKGLANRFVSCIYSDPQNEGHFFAGTEAGLYQTSNHGRNWEFVALQNIPIRTIMREPESWPGIIWVGTEYQGLYESHDGGKTFEPVDMEDDSISVYALAGGGAHEKIFAGLFERGLYAANSAGEIWEPVVGSEMLGTVFCILPIEDTDTIFVGTHEKGVFRSKDKGQTWQPYGLEGAPVRGLILGEPEWATP